MFEQFATFLVALVVLFLFSSIKILKEYERGVIFLLGRFQKVKGPGIIIVIPGIQQMVKRDLRVMNVFEATSQLAQTTLRSVLGQHELDEMLSEREKLNTDIQSILDRSTDAWGIKVSNVEIKHVDLDESMIRAIAAQAEAERSRRAKVIHAEGEMQASEHLLQAAKTLAQQPQSLQLRYLQTLTEISTDKTNTVIFPLPLDLIEPLLKSRQEVSSD
jgi:regulator of protease activity HflC (stomatin/prohibitin superfamily)